MSFRTSKKRMNMSIIQYNRNMNINVVAAIPSNTIQTMTGPFHVTKKKTSTAFYMPCIFIRIYCCRERESTNKNIGYKNSFYVKVSCFYMTKYTLEIMTRTFMSKNNNCFSSSQLKLTFNAILE